MNVRNKRSVIAVSILVAFGTVSVAQTKPNFSGTWKLNTLDSDFGPLPAPANRTDLIEHNEPSLKISTDQAGAQGTQSDVAYYVTNGRDSMNRIGSLDVSSKVSWQGNSLAVASIVQLDDSQVSSNSVWTLSEDGRTLTQRTHWQIATRDIEQTLVFDKAGTTGPSAASTTTNPLASVAAPARADYSGVWRLIVPKSDFGAIPGADIRIDVIEHHEPSLKIDTSQDGALDGKQQYTTILTTDGRAAASHFAGLEGKSTASWVGQNLVVNTRLTFQGSDVAIGTTYTLSEDRKTLTQTSHIKSPTGDIDQKLVFEKQ
jgi:hypothetical protein